LWVPQLGAKLHKYQVDGQNNTAHCKNLWHKKTTGIEEKEGRKIEFLLLHKQHKIHP
jgi:hypothetical protein